MAVLSLFPLIAYCGAKVYFCNRLTGVIHRKVLVVITVLNNIMSSCYAFLGPK